MILWLEACDSTTGMPITVTYIMIQGDNHRSLARRCTREQGGWVRTTCIPQIVDFASRRY